MGRKMSILGLLRWGVITLSVSGVVAAISLVGYTWFERRAAFTVPPPTGPWAVGRTIADWVDPTESDPLAPTPRTPRELLAWLWYPTPHAETNEYIPAAMRKAGWPQTGVLGWLTHDLSRVRANS